MLGRAVGEKKGNLVIKQLHLLHTSEHLNERAALSTRVAFYLSRIKTHVLRRDETAHAFFAKKRRNKMLSEAGGRESRIIFLEKRSL